jgi:hypothetical protein
MSLEQQIQSIIARVASEISHAVRADIAAEVQRVVGGHAPAKAAAAPRQAAAKPVTRRRRRGIDEKSLDTVYQYVARNPGKRSEEIQKAAGVAAQVAKKALVKLRESGRVKMKGTKRAATYAAA